MHNLTRGHSLNAQDVRCLPRQMLPTVHAQKLPGEARRRQDIPQRGGDVGRVGAALEHRRRALPGEVVVALASV